MFTVENLCASYNGKKVFEDVSFSLKENSITALCGMNGSGKSTLLSLMSGIVHPSLKIDGGIFLDGKNILRQRPKDTAKKISYLVQDENPAWNVTVEKVVDCGRFAHRKWYELSTPGDRKIIDGSMELLSISGLRNRPVSTLSGGEYQRTRIARSLAQETDYIFLDEPLSSVDITHQRNLLDILRDLCQKGKTVCISIHDINLASQFSDRMILMRNDRTGIFHGPSDEMMSNVFLRQTYGKDFQIFTHPVTGKKQVW